MELKMADLTFSISQRNLVWHSKGLSWIAVSGPYGLKALPVGIYDIKRREITTYSSAIGNSFKDKSGNGFFLPISPRFKTTRTGLGIHPDGGIPGTLGCIGLQDHNTENFYRTIESISPSSSITLEVKI